MTLLFALALLVAPEQDGFFDMGTLTTTLAQDHVTQSERARARRRDAGSAARYRRSASTASSRQARKNCISALPTLRRRYGASDPRIVRLTGLCRRLGYI